MFRYCIALLLIYFFQMPCLAMASPSYNLYFWSLKIDGVVYDQGDILPAYVDTSNFNETTGLGNITVRIDSPLGGNYSVSAFFDHDIDLAANTYFNEVGYQRGTLDSSVSWEIDEPGYFGGNIYRNFRNDALDGGIGVTDTGNIIFPDDVSMAMGLHFDLFPREYALISFLLGTSDFTFANLEQFDPNSNASIFLGSTLVELPEVSTFLMFIVFVFILFRNPNFGSVRWPRSNSGCKSSDLI